MQPYLPCGPFCFVFVIVWHVGGNDADVGDARCARGSESHVFPYDGSRAVENVYGRRGAYVVDLLLVYLSAGGTPYRPLRRESGGVPAPFLRVGVERIYREYLHLPALYAAVQFLV